MKCPVCGSSKVVVDHLGGAIVCTNCGYVIEEGLIDISGGVKREELESITALRRFKATMLTSEEQHEYMGAERRRERKRIERIVRPRSVEDRKLVAKLATSIKLHKLEELRLVLVALEKRGVLSRRSARMKLAIAEAVREYLHGRYPMFGVIAAEFGVNTESLRKAFKSILGRLGRLDVIREEIESYKGVPAESYEPRGR